MFELEYDQEKDIWYGTSEYGVRSHNIFCNPKIIAWIKTKNGGIGPKAECNVRIKYEGAL